MPHYSSAENFLFTGTHGHVIAIDQSDGSTVWKTSLPKTGWDVVVMLVENGRLLCGTGGRVFALDPIDGRILWENGLPGLGQGVVGLCTLRQPSGSAGAVAGQSASSASATSGAGGSSA